MSPVRRRWRGTRLPLRRGALGLPEVAFSAHAALYPSATRRPSFGLRLRSDSIAYFQSIRSQTRELPAIWRKIRIFDTFSFWAMTYDTG